MNHYIRTGRPKEESTRFGYIAELLVAADLNARCGRAYPNPEPQTEDDVYVKTSGGWRTVQVKMGRVHKNTGALSLRNSGGIKSDMIAVVDIDKRRVRYIPNTRPLPPEITTATTGICSKLVVFAGKKEAQRDANL